MISKFAVYCMRVKFYNRIIINEMINTSRDVLNPVLINYEDFGPIFDSLSNY